MNRVGSGCRTRRGNATNIDRRVGMRAKDSQVAARQKSSRPCSLVLPAPRRVVWLPDSRANTSRSRCPAEGVKLFHADHRDIIAAALFACLNSDRNTPCRCKGRSAQPLAAFAISRSSITGRKPPLVKSSSADAAAGRRNRLFGVITTSGRSMPGLTCRRSR